MSDRQTDCWPDEDQSPPEVPDFALIRPIGRGGFGRVWLARNQTTGHLRAVKVIPLHPRGPSDPAGREIMSITRLEANLRREHPNLLNIHHVGKTADDLFYVMDLADDVSGRAASADMTYKPATLQSRLAGGPLGPEACLSFGRQLLAGLASLHAAGMVHRDVKPANCLFVDGRLKLADFGLLTEVSPQVSQVGTQTYMPPDGRMDARADVYAAGLVIYEMITGLPASGFPRLGHHSRDVIDSPILTALMPVVLGACQREPARRFADARAMLAELEACQTKAARPAAPRRRRTVMAALAIGVVASAVGLGVWSWLPRRVHVNFVTDPFEATIYLDGTLQRDAEGSPYRTPCTVENLPARRHHVMFQHEGRPNKDAGHYDFARTRQIVERWDLD